MDQLACREGFWSLVPVDLMNQFACREGSSLVHVDSISALLETTIHPANRIRTQAPVPAGYMFADIEYLGAEEECRQATKQFTSSFQTCRLSL